MAPHSLASGPARRARVRGSLIVGAIIVAGLLGACRSAPQKCGLYEVEVSRAAFYRHGPAQPTGPDVSLSQGDKVTVLESDHGYSRVALGNGQTGYIASMHLRSLPMKAAPRLASGANTRRMREARALPPIAASADPLFDLQDLPAPNVADDLPRVRPSFRAPR